MIRLCLALVVGGFSNLLTCADLEKNRAQDMLENWQDVLVKRKGSWSLMTALCQGAEVVQQVSTSFGSELCVPRLVPRSNRIESNQRIIYIPLITDQRE